LIDWKNSILLKRLSITPLKKKHFFFIILSFYFLTILFSSLWTFFWIEIITQKNFLTGTTRWSSFIFAWLTVTFTSINLGIFMAGVSRSQNVTQMLVFLIYFPTAFLTGMTFPIYELGQSNSFIDFISFILPHKLPAAWANAAWNGKDVFSYIQIPLWEVIFIVIVINITLSLASKLTFRWETNKD
jgi:hypothetical protein